jgi:hypothetical protein
VASLLKIVEGLKDAAFIEKRRVTVPLARELMKDRGPGARRP